MIISTVYVMVRQSLHLQPCTFDHFPANFRSINAQTRPLLIYIELE